MPRTSSTRTMPVTLVAAEPPAACRLSRSLFTWTSRAMRLGCTRRTTNTPASRRSFMLGLSGLLDMLATLVMVAILGTVDMLCITTLLAMG